jgi:transcriptional regulator with XRE-family HTH domain
VEARRRSGLSRRELARRAGTSPATLAAYEAGRITPSVDTLDRLLDAPGFDAVVALTPRWSTRSSPST